MAPKSTRTDDGLQRTKILLLGQPGSVSFLVTHIESHRVLQKRQDLHPAVPFQRHACEANLLSRTYFSNSQTQIRVRLTSPSCLFSLLTIPQVRSSLSKYGIVLATLPSIPSALLCQNFLQSYLSLTYRCCSRTASQFFTLLTFFHVQGFLSATHCAHAGFLHHGLSGEPSHNAGGIRTQGRIARGGLQDRYVVP
jgi:hypothetical protein